MSEEKKMQTNESMETSLKMHYMFLDIKYV